MVVDLLDRGCDLAKFGGSVHAVAETLLQFLFSLDQPIIPLPLLPLCLRACEEPARCRALLVTHLHACATPC